MEQSGKLILILGLVLAGVGLLVWGLGKAGFRGLPGDIHYRSEDFQFHFPIVTCIVISVFLTAMMWLWHWIREG